MSNETSTIRVLIVDDHTVVRDGLGTMLQRQPDIEVVGDASNGRIAVEMAEKLEPDVVLMDLRMPEMDGVEAMRQIGARQPAVKFLVLTTYDTDEYIFDAIDAGARGFLLKDSSRDDLFKAVRAIYRGESLIQPNVAARLLNRFAEMQRGIDSGDSLSDRELEVLTLIAKGHANKEIAAELVLSESTVKTHVANIFSKLAVNDRTSAVTRALQRGIIKL